jgi:hypothetical protein
MNKKFMILFITIKYKIQLLKCKVVIKLCNFLIWLIRNFIIIKNKIKYLYYKLTTYNTDEIWKICAQKCDCWPGTYEYNGKCDKCEMWNKFSPRLKVQLDRECKAYAHHCMTGE